jgi:hypothetical protein
MDIEVALQVSVVSHITLSLSLHQHCMWMAVLVHVQDDFLSSFA